MKMLGRASLILTVFAPVLCAQRPPQLATQQIEVGRKLALVIGNDVYPSAPLEYPANDAAGMEATLRKLGFDVRRYRNLDLAQMESAIDEFAVSLTDGSFAFVYYSGTGIQALRKNYLVPVDFAGARDWEEVKRQAYPVSRLEDKLEARHARLRVIVLEASRGTRFRVDAMGLEPMRVNREGTLTAFSGYSSSDVDKEEGYASDSMYTKYLMAALLTPGMDLRIAFQKARDDAAHASFKRGNPEIADGIVGRYYLIPADSAATAALWNAGAESRRETLGAETWARIKDSKDPHDFELLARYSPDSEYAPLALVTAARMTRDADAAVTRIDAKDGLAYRWIPPGMFYMGCLHWDNDPQHADVPGSCDPDEKPQHDVTLTKGFWLGQTEVTQEAYRRVTGQNPSTFKGAQLPVETVNWNEAQAYCKAAGMRLPSEAEWEYAAQGGMRLGQAWRASGAWDQERSQSKTHEVGLEPPNPYGLYDMAGNVWEWVADWYGEKYYQSSPAKDPPGPSGGKERVFRGGSFNLNSVYMTQSLRGHNEPGFRGNSVGFRCAGD